MTLPDLLLLAGVAAPPVAAVVALAFGRVPDSRALFRIRGAFLAAVTGAAVAFFALAAAFWTVARAPATSRLAAGPLVGDATTLAFAAALALVTAASVVASRTRYDATHPQAPHPADPAYLAILLGAQLAATLSLVAQPAWLRMAAWVGLPIAIAAMLAARGGLRKRAAIARLLAAPGAVGALQLLVEFRSNDLAGPSGKWIVAAGLIAAGTRLPIPGLHGWLAPMHAALPMSVSAFSSAAFIATGTHALLRLATLAPGPFAAHAPLLATLGAIASLHGALLSIGRRDARELAAYVALALAGLIPLGLSSPNPQGVVGATLVGLGLTLAVPLSLLGLGVPTRRLKTLDLDRLDSIGRRLPEATVLATIGLFACALLPPGLPAAGAWLVVLGALPAHPWAAAAVALSLVVTAATLAFRVQRLWVGRPRSKVDPLPPLGFRERWSLYPLALVVVLLGAAPHLVVRPLEPAAIALARALAGDR